MVKSDSFYKEKLSCGQKVREDASVKINWPTAEHLLLFQVWLERFCKIIKLQSANLEATNYKTSKCKILVECYQCIFFFQNMWNNNSFCQKFCCCLWINWISCTSSQALVSILPYVLCAEVHGGKLQGHFLSREQPADFRKMHKYS